MTVTSGSGEGLALVSTAGGCSWMVGRIGLLLLLAVVTSDADDAVVMIMGESALRAASCASALDGIGRGGSEAVRLTSG